MLELCNELKINVNEFLSGEKNDRGFYVGNFNCFNI